MLCLIDIEHRHAVDRCALSLTGGRIEDIIGSDHDHEVGVLKVVIDPLHLEEVIVRHIRLGEEDIHMARHTTGDGMDGKANFGAIAAKRVSELLHLMLRLRERHTIAGDDDHLLRIVEDLREGGLLLSCRSSRGSGGGCSLGGSFLPRRGSGLAEEDIPEGAIHRPTHDLREEESGGTHDTADGDQHHVTDSHTGDRAGDTGERVEERDRDRHVGTTDADGEEPTEEGGKEDRQTDDPGGVAVVDTEEAPDEEDAAKDEGDGEVEAVILDHLGSAIDDAVELTGGDEATDERDHTDDHGKDTGRGLEGPQREGVGMHAGGGDRHLGRGDAHQGDDTDEGGGTTTEAIEQPDHLRHLDHLDLTSHHKADHETDEDEEEGAEKWHHTVSPEGDEDCQDHRQDAGPVTIDRRGDAAHHPEPGEYEEGDNNSEY